MGHSHSHTDHEHGDHDEQPDADPARDDRRVLWAVIVNVGLTVVQIVAGVFAGSLALVADAIHNLSDAAALALAFIARKIARRPSNEVMTFGYVRAESIAALINYTTLIVIALYLIYEGLWRLADPPDVDGWLVVIVAAIALVIDLATVALTWRMAKESANIRAAFLHNLADALGSVGVIVAGTLIILFDWRIVDPLVTLGIAAYILWHVAREIGGVVRVLMLGTPPGVEPDDVVDALRTIGGVRDVHHLHVWMMDEHTSSLEAHLVVARDFLDRQDALRREAKALLASRFAIAHSTLEIECEGEGCADAETIGHKVEARPQKLHAHAGHGHHH